MKKRSFTIKVFLGFCAVILFSVFVPCAYFVHSTKEEGIEHTMEEAFRETDFIRMYIAEKASEGTIKGREGIKEAIDHIYRAEDHRLTVIDSTGEVLYDSFAKDVDKLENHRYHEEVESAFDRGRGQSVRNSASVGISFAYAAVQVDIPGTDVKIIRVAAPLSLVEMKNADRVKALVAGAVTAFIIALFFAGLISIRFRRSLMLMITSVENMAVPGSRSGRISLRTLPGDEFTPLAVAVNSMAQRMEGQVSHILNQKAQLDAILNSIGEGVLVVDQEGCIRSVNPALTRMLPSTIHSEGRQPVEVISAPELQQGIELIKQGTPEKPVKFIMDAPRGRKLQVLLCPMAEENTYLMAVAVFHDITEMSVLMDMRRDFVANVSHELRTPLTAIMGYAESLRKYVTDSRGVHFLDVIDRNSQYMASMVRELLQLSSIENGSIPMELKPVSVGMLIRGGMELCRSSAEAKKLTITEQVEGGDFNIMADVEYLTRVVRNLLENACHYAPEGSEIRIGVRADKNRNVAEFRVSDSGPGIPPEERSRVFERFYRVEKQRGGQSSTGLGLAICKHIVDRHGGSIRVEDGPGCTVCFTVPLA